MAGQAAPAARGGRRHEIRLDDLSVPLVATGGQLRSHIQQPPIQIFLSNDHPSPDTSPRSRFDCAICKGGRWPDDMAGSFVATADGHGGTHITKVQQTHRSPISR
jgi:hypothetical protein